MCGRFSLRLIRSEIEELAGYGIDIAEWEEQEEFIPRYNIAPRTQVPVIRQRHSGSRPGENDNTIIMQTMKWGLVPHWSKFEDKSLNTINARAENLIEGGGLWASIKGKKRCAIPCQGYYEWLTKGKDKIPYFTKRKDNKILLMAGLYDSVVLEGKTLWTFTIVTTEANREFSWLHERQPVFLTSHDAVVRWLDTSSQTWTPELTKMLQPYSDMSVPLECYAVPKEVGKVGTESPSFIEPIASRPDGIEAMFSKQRRGSPISPTKTQTTPQKRKIQISPSPSQVTNEEVELESTEAAVSPNKRSKTDKKEDNSKQTTSKGKITASPTKRKAVKNTKGTLDSFFGKS